jgi:hypothetical protein
MTHSYSIETFIGRIRRLTSLKVPCQHSQDGLTVAGEMCLTDVPCCVCVKNADFAKVYFVVTLVFEVDETRAEHNVAHSLVRHRYSVLQVFDELNKDMVVQQFVGRLQTAVQGLVKVGVMFLHRIHDFLHQRSPLLM